MKKNTKIIILLCSLIILITSTFLILFWASPKIKEINIKKKINKNNTKTITILIHNPFNKKIKCAIHKEKETDDKDWITANNNKCSFNVNEGKYYISIKD